MRANLLAWTAILPLAITTLSPARAQTPAPLSADQAAFRDLFKELVETNTTVSSGSCTAAAEKMAARLKAAGYKDDQLTLFSVPEFPKDGGLVAVLPGTSKTLKPMLLLGHLDVVEAKREDWTRDPFTMVEENGYYYARGASDMKGMVAAWVDIMARLKKDGPAPKRTIKLALTCGEETGGRFNGAKWLAETKPDLIAAEFALNEGGGGRTDGKGKVVVQSMQIGEKSNRNFRIEATNPGGHSSIPVRENAIYDLGDALAKVRDYGFPVTLNDTTRAFFAKAGASRGDDMGRAMVALSKNPNDASALAMVTSDRGYNSTLRTTCVATTISGGHAENALPQRASANVNCRIFPGETAETTQAALVKAINNPAITVTLVGRIRPIAVPPPLDPRIMGPAEKLVARYFPGVPLVPSMSTGATDATYLGVIGIPTYGVPGGWGDPDGNGAHGLNERREITSLMVGRDFLYDLVTAYASK